jgi:serine/threonine-protein kinase RsbW
MCTSFTEKTMYAPLVIAGKTHDSNDTLHWERVDARCGRATIALTEEIVDLLTDVIGAMEEVGYGARDTFAVCLALAEAVINAVKHGHGNDPRKRARISWVVSPSAVRLVVEHDGAGSDPDRVPDPCLPENQERPGGRGVFHMLSYMSWVRFNDAGNRVVMCRYRS